jgi:hypothetical protein
VGAFARTSRWIFVSRVQPEVPELAAQTIHVAGMQASELSLLCRSVAPSWPAEDLERAARAASGSPWRLLQLAVSRQHTFAQTLMRSPEEDLFSGLDPLAQTLLSKLCQVDRPLPLSALVEDSTVPWLASLSRRGLIELSADARVRAHDVTRGLLSSAISSDRSKLWAEQVAEGLRSRPESECALEAIGLFLRCGQTEKAALISAERADEIVAGGGAARLWQQLQAEHHPGFLAAKRSCALSLEGGPALAWFISEPPPEDLDLRLKWITGLNLASQLPRVLSECIDLEACAEKVHRSDLLAEAQLLRAEVLCNLARPSESAQLLEALSPKDPVHQAVRESLLARTWLLLGRSHEAAQLAERLATRFSTLDSAAKARVFPALVALLGDLGRMRAVARITAETDDVMDYVYQHRVHHLIEAGDLDSGVKAYARWMPFSRWPPLFAIPMRLLYTQLCLMRGAFDGLEQHVSETTREAERLGNQEFIGWTLAGQYLLAILRARPAIESAAAAAAIRTTGPEAFFRAALVQVLAMRTGGEIPVAGWLEESALPDIIDVRINWHRAFAMRAIFESDWAQARRHTEAMGVLAEDNGVAMYSCDTLVLRAELALLMGDPQRAASEAEALAVRATAMGSKHYGGEAEFFKAVSESPCINPGLLEQLALRVDEAPVAARRARALLSGIEGDFYDRKIVAAINRLNDVELVSLSPAGVKHHRAGWGLDCVRKQVWFAEREPLDLARQKQAWDLLMAIADSGEISKDALAMGVWSLPDYHPLRDDKRLQVGLSRLRDALGDEAGRRIETTATGYRIGVHEPLRALRRR